MQPDTVVYMHTHENTIHCAGATMCVLVKMSLFRMNCMSMELKSSLTKKSPSPVLTLN